MHNAALSLFARDCRVRGAFRSSVTILLACCALAFVGNPPVASAQATNDLKPSLTSAAPSAGKALIYIYRKKQFGGSAQYDLLYVNEAFLAKLHSGRYASTEVPQGTVVISSSTTKMSGSYLMGPQAPGWNKKTQLQIHFAVESGKTYYIEWYIRTDRPGNGMRLVDSATGAKGMSETEPAKDKDLQEK